MKRWMLKRSKINTAVMAQELGIRQATACVLANRGLAARKDAVHFMQGGMDALEDPGQMKDMEKGISFLANAIQQKKKIVVYGDYDVDGVMSTSILYRTILRCGGEVAFYVPHRQEEGYGLNMQAVETLAQEGTGLLCTTDNGIAAIAEIKRAKELGMDVVVIDHHEPAFEETADGRKDILPAADALIDPKQRSCPYPFKMLCAGGLAYKAALLLLERFGIKDVYLEKQLLTFASIATVCDIVDLMGENRAIVQMGLAEIQKTENAGLQALIAEKELTGKPITAYHFGFVIGPCINATGRLESAAQAVALFCTEEKEEASEWAKKLAELNEERKALTEEATERARATLEAEGLQDKVLVLYDPEIHESIAGIVAGRIKETYYRPTIMITGSEDGAKGSGRSIEGYHLFEALLKEKVLFTRFGGHAMAAGLSLPVSHIDILRERLNAGCMLTEEQLIPVLRIEKALSFAEIDMTLARELESLSPFGKGNPTPLFASKSIQVKELRLIGKNKDILKLLLFEPASEQYLPAVSFDGYEQLRIMLQKLYPDKDCDTILAGGKLAEPLDIVYTVDINTYKGESSVQLLLKDFRFAEGSKARA